MRRAEPVCLALLAVCAGACEDDAPLSTGEPTFDATPLAIDFGRVFVGQGVQRSVSISATGSAPSRITARFGGGEGRGLIGAPASIDLPPGGAIEFVVSFTPLSAGQRDTVIFLEDGTRTATVTVSGSAAFPPDCEDGNACTTDGFDFDLGVCRSSARDGGCNDFDACTVSDQCTSAICLGVGRQCDDFNACTDDFCDSRDGCVHVLAASCEDDNPCTEDLCDPTLGCRNIALPNGTSCGTGEQCVQGMGCSFGECTTIVVDDGDDCDDGDVCTTQEACSAGECLDPDFAYPQVGELEWSVRVGPLAPGASAHPVLDTDDTVYVPTVDGVVAVDGCGPLPPAASDASPFRWENRTLGGTPLARSMLIAPGVLVVPLEREVVDLSRTTGEELARTFLQEIDGVQARPLTTRILDVAIRGSGDLLLSTWIEAPGESSFGALVVLPRDRSTPHLLQRLGGRHAPRLILDADESPVLTLRDGPPGGGSREQVIRLGLPDLPRTRWSSALVATAPAEISLDAVGRVLWTAGLASVSRDGRPQRWIAPDAFRSGQPVLDRNRVFVTRPGADGVDALVVISSTTGAPLQAFPLGAPARRSTPAVDSSGNVLVATNDGMLMAFDREGGLRFSLDLPFVAAEPISVALGNVRRAVVIASETVYGIEYDLPLGATAWPRHRRDNFGTANR